VFDGSSLFQPVASNSTVTVEEDDIIDFDLTAEDPNDDALTVTVIAGPSNGALNISGLSATDTPDENYFGSDEFTFTVTDGQWTSDSATVSITVLGVNDVPTANAFTLEVEADECQTGPTCDVGEYSNITDLPLIQTGSTSGLVANFPLYWSGNSDYAYDSSTDNP
jgi:hypothetical protein